VAQRRFVKVVSTQRSNAETSVDFDASKRFKRAHVFDIPIMSPVASIPRSAIGGRHIGRAELIVLVAALIAINAFAIDIMLPGLQQIGAALGEADANRRQLLIPSYLLGFGIFQVVFGPLSDRYGRRPPLLAGIAIYCVAALSSFFVADFDSLVVLRFLQGAGASASAVIATALVRDQFAGNEMARVMSLVFTVLMISPILAPGLGQGLLTLVDWRGLFLFMAGLGLAVIVWVWLRLPETLHPEFRRPFTLRAIVEGFGIVFANRTALSYIIATALLFGALMGFLNSSQQVYTETFDAGAWFPAYFAAGAACSAVGGLINSQAVNRFGMRRISFLALAAFCAAGLVMLTASALDALPLALFFALSAVSFFTFSMMMPNFGALAMEPLGEVAGTAASAQGFLQMVLGAAIGTAIGLLYDGSAMPLAAGFTGLGALAGVCIWLVRGR
jgi:DHA1 family bicyclomycin/chloramphenicol resistance-like MFS transporter